jgi:hypothetical protein
MSQPEPRAANDGPHWTLASVALLVIGVVILMLSGLCTGWVGWSFLGEDVSRQPEPIALFFIAIVAVPSLAAGAAFAYAGLKRNHIEEHRTRFNLAFFGIGLTIVVGTGLYVASAAVAALISGDLYAMWPALIFASLPLLVGGTITLAALNAHRDD